MNLQLSRQSYLALAFVLVLSPAAGQAQIGDALNRAKDRVLKKESDAGKPDAKGNGQFTGPKKRLAVMDIDVKVATISASSNPNLSGGTTTTTTVDVPVPTDFGTGLTEMLTTALVDTKHFIVLERKAIQDIQTEQALGTSGSVSSETAAKPSNLLGAQVLVRGAITEFSYRKSSTGTGGVLGSALDISHSSADAMVALDIRLYDAETGQILDSVRAEGRAGASATAAHVEVGSLKLGTSSFSSTPLGAASRQAIVKATKLICDRMEARPWEGRVAEIDIDDNKITSLYLNAGSRSGIKEGDEFDLFRPGRPIVNPETKVVIGRTKDKLIGRCKVESVQDDVATASLVSGGDVQKGDLVRPVAPKQDAKPATPAPAN